MSFTFKEMECIEDANGNMRNDSSKYHQPKTLTRLGMESILSYLEANRRLNLSSVFPEFREIENSVPLKLEYLEISKSEIRINHGHYTLKNEMCEASRAQKVLNFVSKSLADRTQLTVEAFRSSLRLPFQLKMDVGLIRVAPYHGAVAENYSNLVGPVGSVTFQNLNNTEDLKHPFVQRATRLDKVFGDNRFLLEELPNLQAQIIYSHFQHDTVECEDLFVKWCELRKGRIGSKLVLAIDWFQEEATIGEVFESRQLAEIGFVQVSRERLHFSMDQDSEARLTVEENTQNFREDFVMSTMFRRHLQLEVVRKGANGC